MCTRPVTAMCDVNARRQLDEDDELRSHLVGPAPRVELVSTHAQDDEIANGPQHAVPVRQIPMADFVIGFSRRDMGRLGDGFVYSHLQGNARAGKHSYDGLIAGTAAIDADVLVTGDKRLTRRSRQVGVLVWSYDELRAYALTGQAPSSPIQTQAPRP